MDTIEHRIDGYFVFWNISPHVFPYIPGDHPMQCAYPIAASGQMQCKDSHAEVFIRIVRVLSSYG